MTGANVASLHRCLHTLTSFSEKREEGDVARLAETLAGPRTHRRFT